MKKSEFLFVSFPDEALLTESLVYKKYPSVQTLFLFEKSFLTFRLSESALTLFCTRSHRRVAYLRRFYESQPIGRVRWQQPHGLTLVDGQSRAQQVSYQVDQALQPLLAGALQQLEG